MHSLTRVKEAHEKRIDSISHTGDNRQVYVVMEITDDLTVIEQGYR